MTSTWKSKSKHCLTLCTPWLDGPLHTLIASIKNTVVARKLFMWPSIYKRTMIKNNLANVGQVDMKCSCDYHPCSFFMEYQCNYILIGFYHQTLIVVPTYFIISSNAMVVGFSTHFPFIVGPWLHLGVSIPTLKTLSFCLSCSDLLFLKMWITSLEAISMSPSLCLFCFCLPKNSFTFFYNLFYRLLNRVLLIFWN